MKLTKLRAAATILMLGQALPARAANVYLDVPGYINPDGTIGFLFDAASPSLGPISEWVFLDIPGPFIAGSLSGSLSSNIAAGKPGAIDFTTAQLQEWTDLPTRSVLQDLAISTVDGFGTANLTSTRISIGTPPYRVNYTYVIKFDYTSDLPNSLVTGRFTLAPAPEYVPEPFTWAMFIVGLGLTGIAMRRSMPLSGVRRPKN